MWNELQCNGRKTLPRIRLMSEEYVRETPTYPLPGLSKEETLEYYGLQVLGMWGGYHLIYNGPKWERFQELEGKICST
jgi:hypothetical protein